MEGCQNYSWPGNLRELENFVKKYMLTGEASVAGKVLSDQNISQTAHDSPAGPRLRTQTGRCGGPTRRTWSAMRGGRRSGTFIVSALENYQLEPAGGGATSAH
jgi:DNA-binding NtrC family response regulator